MVTDMHTKLYICIGYNGYRPAHKNIFALATIFTNVHTKSVHIDYHGYHRPAH